jgi:hypothetical protein
MSDQELYEIASKRIHRRNRRWMLWSVNLGVLILALAGLILSRGNLLVISGFFAWCAVFVTHTIILAFAESTEGSIENEVVKLRKAVASDQYEKPKKRLELGEDGELTEVEDREPENAQRNRNS